MHHDRLLHFALAPSAVLFILSLISVVLTVHYWIYGDWIMTRAVNVPTTNFDTQLQQYKTDATIVWYIDQDTDATISSTCLNLTAAIVALIAWIKLRQVGTNSKSAAASRRLWLVAVLVMSVVGGAIALAAFALHYTSKGKDPYGCTPETFRLNGNSNTNMYCTREMAACNFLPKFIKPNQRGIAAMACNETVVVKWFQLLLAIDAAVIFALFGAHAWLRRKHRRAAKAGLKEAI